MESNRGVRKDTTSLLNAQTVEVLQRLREWWQTAGLALPRDGTGDGIGAPGPQVPDAWRALERSLWRYHARWKRGRHRRHLHRHLVRFWRRVLRDDPPSLTNRLIHALHDSRESPTADASLLAALELAATAAGCVCLVPRIPVHAGGDAWGQRDSTGCRGGERLGARVWGRFGSRAAPGAGARLATIGAPGGGRRRLAGGRDAARWTAPAAVGAQRPRGAAVVAATGGAAVATRSGQRAPGSARMRLAHSASAGGGGGERTARPMGRRWRPPSTRVWQWATAAVAD
eukprot:ctg_1284.g406